MSMKEQVKEIVDVAITKNKHIDLLCLLEDGSYKVVTGMLDLKSPVITEEIIEETNPAETLYPHIIYSELKLSFSLCGCKIQDWWKE